ncbi:hypothetical protein VAR608DRAFT_5144 [Variovorax sp. HW608]|uniref:hypothetical protein n=1 Tax=Variovorax sp. HW608 TaxID=1034889 RepID=UPI00081FF5A9|nr:hypothetical protein [Variovorax sp. HW608]SCK51198.1 hypothetical protein VAR608DRAFT_5144 [Variovorax sp. HW608]
MNKRSAGGSFPKFGWQWIISLALLATAGLGGSIIEGLSGTHPSHAAAMHAGAAQAQPTEGISYPVPAASGVFANTPAPQSTEVIPSF